MSDDTPPPSTECTTTTASWSIETPLTIYTAGILQPLMLDRIAGPDGLVMDLHGVESCDAAGLQLLCAARKSALIAGRHFQITALSPALVAAMEDIGLDPVELAESIP
ncbi:MAG: STAS domain-containing protein [Verrucomicrobiota bacterium]|nr:STAS domain-containing protein [Verrucomicrobiota bacterium]